jgi:hypothetical protein
MSMSVTATANSITSAINDFSSSYHADYFNTRASAKSYLASYPPAATASRLSSDLHTTLTNWGAGRRQAPSCQAIANITSALNSSALHKNLVDLAASINHLTIDDSRRKLTSASPFATVSDFDRCLIETLNQLSAGFFIGNTNVTYPMKSLLLLTGLMPALDSQVKGGLNIAGVAGVNRTQFLIPPVGSTDAKKICVLPFLIADCASRFSSVINSGVSASHYPRLSSENGRIFDVLFFQQNSLTRSTRLISFIPHGIPWYNI